VLDLLLVCKESLKKPKVLSELVYRRRTDNTMAKRKGTKGKTTIYKTYTYRDKIDACIIVSCNCVILSIKKEIVSNVLLICNGIDSV
jgi:hypothetical protein